MAEDGSQGPLRGQVEGEAEVLSYERSSSWDRVPRGGCLEWPPCPPWLWVSPVGCGDVRPLIVPGFSDFGFPLSRFQVSGVKVLGFCFEISRLPNREFGVQGPVPCSVWGDLRPFPLGGYTTRCSKRRRAQSGRTGIQGSQPPTGDLCRWRSARHRPSSGDLRRCHSAWHRPSPGYRSNSPGVCRHSVCRPPGG